MPGYRLLTKYHENTAREPSALVTICTSNLAVDFWKIKYYILRAYFKLTHDKTMKNMNVFGHEKNYLTTRETFEIFPRSRPISYLTTKNKIRFIFLLYPRMRIIT